MFKDIKKILKRSVAFWRRFVGFVGPAACSQLAQLAMASSPSKRARMAESESEHSLGLEAEAASASGPLISAGQAENEPLRKPHWHHDDVIPPGPESYGQIAGGCWASHIISRAASSDSPMLSSFVDAFEAGVSVTTSYSGMGSAEVACHILAAEALKAGAVLSSNMAGLQSYAACDIDAVCQTVLKNTLGAHRPRHVFGSLLDMVPSRDVARLQTLLQHYRATIDANVATTGLRAGAASDLRTKLVAELGDTFLDRAQAVMRRWAFTRSDKAWCVR